MTQTPEELRNAKAAMDAQAAVIRSQADLIRAQGELRAAQTPPNAAVAAANAERARIEAARALVDARQGLSTSAASADLAAAQAAIGTVTAPAGAPTGGVTVGTNAGKGESTLLASRAVNLAAGMIAARLRAERRDKACLLHGKTVVLMCGLDSPQFANYQQFEIRQDVLVRLMQSAVDAAARARRRGDGLKPAGGGGRGPGPVGESVALLTGVGVALDALNKLGGYFRSDFSINNIDVAGDTTQLVTATAGSLLALPDEARPTAVIVPSVALGKIDDLKQLMGNLVAALQPVQEAASQLEAEAGAARAASQAETDTDLKAGWDSAADAYEAGLPPLAQAQTRVDEFLTSLSAADSAGTMLIAKILSERTAYKQLQGEEKLALFLDIRATAGGAYSKRNLWTFFGALPFFAMGGVVASYSVVDPATGGLVASGLVPVHGGYHAVKKVAEIV